MKKENSQHDVIVLGSKYIYQSVRHSNSNSKGRKSRFLRDVFKAWNTDWREPAAPSLTVK
jgi:hypothetical protein